MTMPVPADRGLSTDGPAHTGPDHDEGLVAGLAAGDLDPREADEARALVAACPACARLEADVRSIMAATTALPVRQRSRDFRLTEADAARLRPSGWQRILEPFARPRLAFAGPLAGGLVTLGIAGLILASIPMGTAPAGEATAAGDAAGPAAPALSGESGQIFAPASAYSNLAVPASAGPSQPQPAASDNRAAAGPVASAAANVPPAGVGGSSKSTASPAGATPVVATGSGVTLLALGSIVLLALGLGLFVLRWAAKTRFRSPGP
jgi:hypothetical protein